VWCEFVFEDEEGDDEYGADESYDDGEVGYDDGCVVVIFLWCGLWGALCGYVDFVCGGVDGAVGGGDHEVDVVVTGLFVGMYWFGFGAGGAIAEVPFVGEFVWWCDEVECGCEEDGL